MTTGLFSSTTPHWATPKAVYDELNTEFHFDDDPCPLFGNGGLDRKWGRCVYMNPPYGRAIVPWVKRAYEEAQKGKVVVCLLPSRTDTRWWHDYVMKASEIRFIKGRLHFNDSPQGAPFPSAIIVFNGIGEAKR
jgi:site-specific DNA-methyltransferase (adenine-specific)